MCTIQPISVPLERADWPEPTTIKWRLFKVFFLVQNLVSIIAVVFSALTCVVFAIVISGHGTLQKKDNTLASERLIDYPLSSIQFSLESDEESSELTPYAKTGLTFLIPVTITSAVQIILGFLGVCQLNVIYLKIYRTIEIILLLLGILMPITKYFTPFVSVIGAIGRLLITSVLIRELQRAPSEE